MLWADFLQDVPPNTEKPIEDLFVKAGPMAEVRKSPIEIHCWSDTCSDERIFEAITNLRKLEPTKKEPAEGIITYACRNCVKSLKYFAVRCWKDPGEVWSGRAIKFGEIPPYGPHVPSRVISLIGPDLDLFAKGRRSENQGLGIGAFAYYRQIIERQKDHLLTEIRNVAQRLGASASELELFDQAIREWQFNKAIKSVEAAIPESLLIEGQNPLTLLHGAVSRDIHLGTDEECLENAHAVRVVLTELAERITAALRDQTELKQAVNRLQNQVQKKREDQRKKEEQGEQGPVDPAP